MRIVCVGGGPGGLYFSVLARQADPGAEVTVYERNRPEDTFGFGVVLSDATTGFLLEQDRESYPQVLARARRWDPITVIHGGRTMRCGGVGFSAIERRTLLEVLRERARELGVRLVFEHEVPDPRDHLDADLLIGSDGVNSAVRRAFEDRFAAHVDVGPTRFTWLGTTRPFDSLTFFFEGNEHGQFGAHVYPYAPDRATFIVETDERTFERAGIARFSEEDTIAYCERLFARHLDGHRLLSNRSVWQHFRTVRCERWHHDNVVLLGDAAHTAHFSVGSGTKMALEDALVLSHALGRHPGHLGSALAAYEAERRPRVEHVQAMARTSFDWWASFRRYTHLPPERFGFHFLTRSQFRTETLRARDPAYVAAVERAAGLDLRSRVIGLEPAEGDQAALESLADRCALVLTRLLPVSEEGRITPEDGRLEDYTELAGRLRLGAQLSHAGPRGACLARRHGLDRPLPEAARWPLLAASALPYTPCSPVPRAIDRDDMDRVRDDFAAAARLAARLCFRFLQLQFGHGYLLGTFISPLTNRREDGYGGAIGDRLRFPLEVLDAVRTEFPDELAVAISATDWAPGGLTRAEALTAARLLREHGADFVTALGGQTTPRALPPYGRCFQMLHAGRIQNEAGVPAIAAGGVTDLEDVRTILLSGRAERCILDPAPSGPDGPPPPASGGGVLTP